MGNLLALMAPPLGDDYRDALHHLFEVDDEVDDEMPELEEDDEVDDEMPELEEVVIEAPVIVPAGPAQLSDERRQQLRELEAERRTLLDHELELDTKTEAAISSDLLKTRLTLVLSGGASAVLGEVTPSLWTAIAVFLPTVAGVALIGNHAWTKIGDLAPHIIETVRDQRGLLVRTTAFRSQILGEVPASQHLSDEDMLRLDQLVEGPTGLASLIKRERFFIVAILCIAVLQVASECFVSYFAAAGEAAWTPFH